MNKFNLLTMSCATFLTACSSSSGVFGAIKQEVA